MHSAIDTRQLPGIWHSDARSPTRRLPIQVCAMLSCSWFAVATWITTTAPSRAGAVNINR